MLSYIRGQLRDWTYNISKIYGFRAGKGYHSLDVKFKDFVLPDFKIEVKLKDQSLRDSLSLKNLFLYGLENMIKGTFVTELSKEFSIYILITFSGENKKNKKLDLINPSNN